jgi:SOS-response transcriptional repressor LexA
MTSRFSSMVYAACPAGTTAPQRAVLKSIVRLTAALGHPPTVREIAADIGVNPSDVQQKMWRLRRDGRVTWDEGRARTVRVVGVTQ